MNYQRFIVQGLIFILFVTIQVTLFKNLALFDRAFCFVYLGFLLFLPFDTDNLALLVMGFVTGIIVDVFYDSLGVHAAASVFVAFLRPGWVTLITPQGGYDEGASPSISRNGLFWYLRYVIPLILVHQLAIFYLEAGGFSLFFFTLVKALSSSLLTFVVLLLVQLLFYRR